MRWPWSLFGVQQQLAHGEATPSSPPPLTVPVAPPCAPRSTLIGEQEWESEKQRLVGSGGWFEPGPEFDEGVASLGFNVHVHGHGEGTVVDFHRRIAASGPPDDSARRTPARLP